MAKQIEILGQNIVLLHQVCIKKKLESQREMNRMKRQSEREEHREKLSKIIINIRERAGI